MASDGDTCWRCGAPWAARESADIVRPETATREPVR